MDEVTAAELLATMFIHFKIIYPISKSVQYFGPIFIFMYLPLNLD